MSWSLFLMEDMAFHKWRMWWKDQIQRCEFPSLESPLTVMLQTDAMPNKAWFTLEGFWFPFMMAYLQLMSGRLKSLLRRKMLFLLCLFNDEPLLSWQTGNHHLFYWVVCNRRLLSDSSYHRSWPYRLWVQLHSQSQQKASFSCQKHSAMRVCRSVSPLYVVTKLIWEISLEAMDWCFCPNHYVGVSIDDDCF